MTANLNYEKRLNKEISQLLKKSISVNAEKKNTKSVTFEEFLYDKMQIIAVIREGLPISIFNLIQKFTPFTDSEWANFLDISLKSLQRYKSSDDHIFKSIHSEIIIAIAEVIKLGLDLFSDIEKLKLWLDTPNFALGKFKPIDLIKDSYGRELVVNEITRINYGIFV